LPGKLEIRADPLAGHAVDDTRPSIGSIAAAIKGIAVAFDNNAVRTFRRLVIDQDGIVPGYLYADTAMLIC
jgi:hypothetical protein